MPEQHAFLSPSGAKLWLQSPACWYREAPKLEIEEQLFVDSFEDPRTASEEGTLGHELVERILRREYGVEPEKAKPLRKLRKSKYFSYELERYARWCANETITIIDEYDDLVTDLFFEMRVHCKSIHDQLWGTSDVVIVTGDMLHIVDFKFGRLPVHADGNPQLKIYAYGALDTLDKFETIEIVRGSILQPRNYDRDDMELTAAELHKWGKRKVKPKARKTADLTGKMSPSLETCRYCKHKVTDASHRKMFLETIIPGRLAKMDKQPQVSDLDMKEIETIAANAAMLKQWIDDVTKFAQGKAFGGYPFKKVKLVRGHSRRSFSDTKRVQRRLRRMGLSPTEYMKEPDVKPLTEIEALLGKTKFNSTLGPLINSTENRPRLVAADSKEKAFETSVKDIADEFGL